MYITLLSDDRSYRDYSIRIIFMCPTDINCQPIVIIRAVSVVTIFFRWSVLLWEKMAFQDTINNDTDSDEFEYLSTHPGHQKRSTFLEKLLPEVLLYCGRSSVPHSVGFGFELWFSQTSKTGILKPPTRVNDKG